jgi:hypothetical protein
MTKNTAPRPVERVEGLEMTEKISIAIDTVELCIDERSFNSSGADSLVR